MLYILNEENSDLRGRSFVLPDGLRQHLNNTFKNYKGDKNQKGYDRLKFILSSNAINYREMKRLKNFFETFNRRPDDDEYILNGGEPMKIWVLNTLNSATASVNATKKLKKQLSKNLKANANAAKAKKVTTSTKRATSGRQYESVARKIIKLTEYQVRHLSEGFIEDTDDDTWTIEDAYSNIFEQFFECKGNGRLHWNRINPSMYKRALEEFMRFGEFVKFPTKYIYQWLGIVRKNTLMLEACTAICGHAAYYPLEELEDFFCKLLKREDLYVHDSHDGFVVYYEITPQEVRDLCAGLKENYAIHKNGQYNLFLNQDEVDEYDVNKEFAEIIPLIDKFNESKTEKYHNGFGGINVICNEYLSIDKKTKEIHYNYDAGYLMEKCGLYDFLKLPDGTDAISDFGLAPLFELLDQYHDEMTPEEAIILLNKLLDVYHQRGDLSSAFIEGGSKTLSQISGT